MSATETSPSLRSWLLLAAAFTTFSIGAAFMHAYTVFLVTFIEVFGWTRAQVSIAYAVAQAVNGISSPFVGWLVDRLGTRRLILIGGTVLTLGLLISAHVNALWQIVIVYGVVMTMGSNCLGLVVFVPLLSRLFVRNRGMAVSIVQSANGFARAFSAPVTTMMISGLGWRGAYLWQGIFMGVVLLPLAALFRGAGQGTVRRSAEVDGWTLRQAVRTPHFWLLFLVYLFTGLGSFLVALHQLAFAVDIGFSQLYAAGVLGMGAFLSLPGVIVTGTISDYIGRELSAIVTYGTSILGVVFGLMIHSPDQHLLLWLHACFFGLTWGARGPAITAKTADLFPGPNLGTILGVITIGTGLGAALGSWSAGFVFDVTGSYRVAFWLSILFYVAGSIAFWGLRRPPAKRA
ncbi:MAG TPA: MFS transporter [Rhodopila sp.]|uniref:MFS transporter n=1 Tax=Rhodopila sp. TaxID=2480087 RepID=UPI002B60BB34|nr:MFS transporter [Rhodopila sp.]HVY15670.1 MFS transporter [Rhodopila sp.]